MKRLLVFIVFVFVAVACSKKEDVIVQTAGPEASHEEIDRDPVALLPGGAIALIRVDAQTMFASDFGKGMQDIAERRMPLPASAGFEPKRDLQTLYIAFYSMQGADFAMVARGTFDPKKIEAAADGTTMTPLGAPLVKTTYAKRTLYVSRNVGFVVLTERTVLLGNETGIRRALDRIAEGRVKRSIPSWMEKLLATPKAAVVAGVDFKGQPAVKAAVGDYAFLDGLETGRVVGNFEPPGMNFAGTLTYEDEAKAEKATTGLLQINDTLQRYSLFMSLAGIQNPIRNLQAKPVGKESQFVVSLEGRAVEWLVKQLADYVGMHDTRPIPATTGTAAPSSPPP